MVHSPYRRAQGTGLMASQIRRLASICMPGTPHLELAGLTVAFGLLLVTAPAPRPEVVGRRGPVRTVGFDVIVFGFEAVAAIHTSDAVEARRGAELQCEADLDRRVAGPPTNVAEINTVVENARQK